MTNLAVFASGTGSNARKIMEYFADRENIRVALVVSNNPEAGVLKTAHEFGIPSHITTRREFTQTQDILKVFNAYSVDFVALAGFLWLVPPYLVQAFSNKILNIHPALLPKYGGKGMYGIHVHRAVKAAGETESGPTIHFVNEQYDEGNIVFQTAVKISPSDTAEDIQRKVLAAEHENYARVIEEVINHS